MRLLDLFCGAGGAAMGYHRAGRAGFDEIVGVDIKQQPRYPFEFVHGDALEYLSAHGAEFDFIHANPPCQAYSAAANQWRAAGADYPNLVGETREALIANGRPWVIENVPGSPLVDPVLLTAALFGILVSRDRLFETSFDIQQPDLPKSPKPIKMGRPVSEGDVVVPVGHFSGVDYARREMGISWMRQQELAQAIPPAYTEWIGRQYLATQEAA